MYQVTALCLQASYAAKYDEYASAVIKNSAFSREVN